MAQSSKKKRSRQIETVRAFLNKEPAYGGSVQSDGGRLYSYTAVIGEWVDGKIVMPEYGSGWLRTTVRHYDMLRSMATVLGIEVVDKATK